MVTRRLWHPFRAAEVIDDARDLLKLTGGLAKQADVMTRHGSK